MAQKEYRVIFKCLCNSCLDLKKIGKLGIDCKSCTFGKYHTSDLLSFLHFLDTKFPNWTWWRVYDKTTRAELACYKNTYKTYISDSTGKKVCTGTMRDIPSTKQITQ